MNTQWGKDSSSRNGVGKNSRMKRSEIGPLFYTTHKCQLKF